VASNEALAKRIFEDDEWCLTTGWEGILEGKHPEILQWGSLADYLMLELVK
jgi:hypothetical protein